MPETQTLTSREEFDSLRTATAAILDKAKTEKRDLTEVERRENDERFARMESIKTMNADEQKLAEFTAVQFAATPPAVRNDVVIKVGETHEGFDRTLAAKKQAYAKHVLSVEKFIRTGERDEFAITTGTGSGVMLPKDVAEPTFIRRIFNPIYQALSFYGLSAMTTTGTETISIPIFDDSAIDGVVTSEGSTSETTSPGDPSAANGDAGAYGIQLGAKLYDSGVVWNSNTQLSAISYDLLGYLSPALNKRIDHKQAIDWFGKIQTNGTVGATAATATGVTYDDVNALYFSLSAPYRSDGAFFVSDSFMSSVSGLKDSQGHPLYRQSMRDGDPDTLFGRPIWVSDGLGTVAAGHITAAFCSAEALKVRVTSERRLIRYSNLPTHPDQVGLQLFANSDFGFIPSGVRVLKQAAS